IEAPEGTSSREHVPLPEDAPAFADFTASDMFCPICRQAQPVRLVGTTFVCTMCQARVGEKLSRNGTGPPPAPCTDGRMHRWQDNGRRGSRCTQCGYEVGASAPAGKEA